jgi:hypothetical protein
MRFRREGQGYRHVGQRLDTGCAKEAKGTVVEHFPDRTTA